LEVDHSALINQYLVQNEPYYRPTGDEVDLFGAAYAVRMPMMLKGPTGCGKTRFVEYMAWRLGRPLITIACHEDMTASDLVGRHLLDASGTRWQDGPLTLAVRFGAICYLDENRGLQRAPLRWLGGSHPESALIEILAPSFSDNQDNPAVPVARPSWGRSRRKNTQGQ
jgi:hypothetical protein